MELKKNKKKTEILQKWIRRFMNNTSKLEWCLISSKWNEVHQNTNTKR